MFNQFHDILPGSSIREVYIDAAETHKEAQEIGTFELAGSLQHVAQHITTSNMRGGTPVVVFNPLSWERTDIVKVSLPKADEADYAVFDGGGKEVLSQTVQTGRYQREVMFVAQQVPSLGYKTYQLRGQKPTRTGNLNVTKDKIENAIFAVSIDPQTGWVKSIIDKRNGKEVLSGQGNELQLLADYPREYDAWNIGLTGVTYPSAFRKAEVVESGPLRVVLRLSRDYLKPGVKKDFPTEDFPSSFFTQDIILYDGLDRIDFKTDVDWWEDKTFLKVAFPVTVSDSVATYEIPAGTIQRSTQMRNSWERAKVEVPARSWADLSQADYGVSLLNNSKYGYDVKGNVIRLSLLRSPKSPDPTADRGKHSIDFALYPHKGTWREAQTVRKGYEYNYPLMAVMTDVRKGDLPQEFSFVQISPSNLVLNSIKKSEDGDAWIVQWYEAEGRPADAVVSFPKAPKAAVISNFLEEAGAPALVRKNSVLVKTRASSIVTVRVNF
jgi:alpha-mannosidase